MSIRPTTGDAPPAVAAGSPYRFGKYTLLAKLAQGGMGEVFAALLRGAAGFEKLVVIKRILPHLAEDPRFVTMFLDEARLTASLGHPNICQVFELGDIDNDYYLAMEYLEGVSLSRLVKKRLHQGLDLRVAGGIVCQALEGLNFAHRFRQPGGGLIGVIHRDMSPSNVFVTTAGQVKVLDFGVAKVSHHAKTTVTGLKGKYPYMAPEQIRGLELDGRSDLFAVGVVLFESVTGEPLFHRENDFDTLQAIVSGERPRASDYRPDIPLDLDEVIDRSLRVTREERYASAREMSDAITRALAPMGGPCTSGELADLLRRECHDELDDERSRIDRATDALKILAGKGLSPPDLHDRRARPVVDTEINVGFSRHSPAPFATAGDKEKARRGPSLANSPSTSAATSIGGLAPGAGSTAESVSVLSLRLRRSPWLWLLGAGLVAAVFAIVVVLASGDSPPSDKASDGAGDKLAADTVQAPETTGAALPTDGDDTAAAVPPADDSGKSTGLEDAGAAAVLPVDAGGKVTDLNDAGAAATTATKDDAKGAPAESDQTNRGNQRRQNRRTTKSKNDAEEKSALPAGPGYLSMSSMPWAKIYVDGKFAGITPLYKLPLKPGKHSIKAVTESGAQKKTTITVESGKSVTRKLEIPGE